MRTTSAAVDLATSAQAPALKRWYFGAALLFGDHRPIWRMTVDVTQWLCGCHADAN